MIGTVGALHDLALVIALVAIRDRVRTLVEPGERPGRFARRFRGAPPSAVANGRALAAAGLVFAHWSIEVRLVLDAGDHQLRLDWYHGPFAAGFAQGHSTFELAADRPQFWPVLSPDSELLHGSGYFAFDRDSLSPLLKLAFGRDPARGVGVGRPFGLGR